MTRAAQRSRRRRPAPRPRVGMYVQNDAVIDGPSMAPALFQVVAIHDGIVFIEAVYGTAQLAVRLDAWPMFVTREVLPA